MTQKSTWLGQRPFYVARHTMDAQLARRPPGCSAAVLAVLLLLPLAATYPINWVAITGDGGCGALVHPDEPHGEHGGPEIDRCVPVLACMLRV